MIRNFKFGFGLVLCLWTVEFVNSLNVKASFTVTPLINDYQTPTPILITDDIDPEQNIPKQRLGKNKSIAFLFIGFEVFVQTIGSDAKKRQIRYWQKLEDLALCYRIYTGRDIYIVKFIEKQNVTNDFHENLFQHWEQMQLRIDFVTDKMIKFIKAISTVSNTQFDLVSFDAIFIASSVGVQVASEIGDYFRKSQDSKVKYICGFDPILLPISLKYKRFSKDIAEYTQKIISAENFQKWTLKNFFYSETHSTIVVDDKCPAFNETDHFLTYQPSSRVAHLTITRKSDLKAVKTLKNPQITLHKKSKTLNELIDKNNVESDACIVGPFNQDKHEGIYYLIMSEAIKGDLNTKYYYEKFSTNNPN